MRTAYFGLLLIGFLFITSKLELSAQGAQAFNAQVVRQQKESKRILDQQVAAAALKRQRQMQQEQIAAQQEQRQLEAQQKQAAKIAAQKQAREQHQRRRRVDARATEEDVRGHREAQRQNIQYQIEAIEMERSVKRLSKQQEQTLRTLESQRDSISR